MKFGFWFQEYFITKYDRILERKIEDVFCDIMSTIASDSNNWVELKENVGILTDNIRGTNICRLVGLIFQKVIEIKC